MELITYNELRELALKENIKDNKVSIGMWAKIKGYTKKKKQKNNVVTFYYTLIDNNNNNQINK